MDYDVERQNWKREQKPERTFQGTKYGQGPILKQHFNPDFPMIESPQ